MLKHLWGKCIFHYVYNLPWNGLTWHICLCDTYDTLVFNLDGEFIQICYTNSSHFSESLKFFIIKILREKELFYKIRDINSLRVKYSRNLEDITKKRFEFLNKII